MIPDTPDVEAPANASKTNGSTKDANVDIEIEASGPRTDPRMENQDVKPASSQPLEGIRLWAVAIAVCFGALMMALDISVIATAIPSIMSDFHDTSRISWYPAAYSFTTCALTPIAGKMASVFSLKWVYLSFALMFLIGSLICGCAPTSNAFIAGRAIAGIGAAGVASNGLTILLAIAPDKKKPLVMGLGASCFGIGLILAPILGGALTQKLTWRWCFWINLPPGAVTLTTIFFLFKPKRSRNDENVAARIMSLDPFGCLIFVPAIFMLLLALQQGGAHGNWNTATIIGLFVGSGVMIILFIVWENRRADGAMIPGSVVGRRTVIFTIMFAFCHVGSITVAAYYLPEWFQAVQGVGPLQSGLRMLSTVIPQIIATIFASILAMRIKYYNPWFFIGPILMCIAMSLYTQFTAFSTPASHWIGFQVLGGIGAGFAMQMCSLAVQLELKASSNLVPIGIALVLFAQYLGVTVMQVIAGTVFNSQLKRQLTVHAGLNASQINLLLGGGTKNARETINENFPTLFVPTLEAYNSAVTRAFFVPVCTTAIEFLLAFGIKWNKIEGTEKKVPNSEVEIKNEAPLAHQQDVESKDNTEGLSVEQSAAKSERQPVEL